VTFTYTLGIRVFDPKTTTTFAKLTKLDDVSSPGLPDHLFVGLFMQCHVCHYTMTKRVFRYHTCLGEMPTAGGPVIDLSAGDEASDMGSETEPGE
jgi:hypothetical protein